MTDTHTALSGPIGSNLLEDDPEFEEIVVEFVEALANRVLDMEDALRPADFEKLQTLAHQLKGCGAGYGYPVVSERAANLEQCAKNRVAHDCTAVLGEMKEICSRIVVCVEPDKSA